MYSPGTPKCRPPIRQQPGRFDDFYRVQRINEIEPVNEISKTLKRENLRKNPIAAFISAAASFMFWTVYILARSLIYLSLFAIILNLFLPKHGKIIMNHVMQQYDTERAFFRDEL